MGKKVTDTWKDNLKEEKFILVMFLQLRSSVGSVVDCGRADHHDESWKQNEAVHCMTTRGRQKECPGSWCHSQLKQILPALPSLGIARPSLTNTLRCVLS